MAGTETLFKLKELTGSNEKKIQLTGLSGSALSYFFSQFLADFERPCLFILPTKKEAEDLYNELSFFMEDKKTGFSDESSRLFDFPPYEISPLTGLSPHREIVSRRIHALYSLMTYDKPVVITSMDVIFFRTIPKDALVGAMELFQEGEELDRDLFLQKLEISGYQRSALVEERGDYSVRGGVIDVYSPIYPNPVRLEFWGDRLESIRQFDPLSQRSLIPMKEITFLPASEIILESKNVAKARSMGRLPFMEEGSYRFSGQEAWLNHFYHNLGTIFQYLPRNGLIILSETHNMEPSFKKLVRKFDRDVLKYRQEAAEKRKPFPETAALLMPFEELHLHIDTYQTLQVNELELYAGDNSPSAIKIQGGRRFEEKFEIVLSGKGKVSIAPLANRISTWLDSGSRVVLTSRTEQQADRLRQILESYDVTINSIVKSWADVPKDRGLYLCLGRLKKGFSWEEYGLHVISEDEIFGTKTAHAGTGFKKTKTGFNWSNLSQLKAGDFVVHEDHGIGRYGGLVLMEIDKKVNEFVIVEYSNNSKLYIPADRVSIIQKYAGAEDREPKLDQLGGPAWQLTKQKAGKSVKRIAKQLVELYALRKHSKGHTFSVPDHYFREFEATFEHEETADQTKAVESILEDMTSDRPMDRLICGDVGFGKTEIAVRAAFKAVADGKQVALLVPTTVLAEQHYDTFLKRMANYSIEIGILSRFKSRSEQMITLKHLHSGKIDILIGTHRILQKDVKFADLGLLIVDEEQRFGVKQKELLKKYRATVDVLAITATPVPRTLQMSMMNIRDLSIIETPPRDRSAIETYLTPYDEATIVRAVQFELDRGGQIFFVHNRVKTIEDTANRIKNLIPGARFAIAHGQMKGKDLENTMMQFLNKNIDVLVCSTIIESGLDIPSANTIIINEVDRLGLSQIYQLRGRVGRSSEKAYAYLMLSADATLTRDAEKRLKALMDFSHLGAGLNLALHDLEIRGGGNILGFAQSGQIAAVGYELYLKLIERAVSELKGEEWNDDINPEINMKIPAFLPGDYVVDTDVRLNIYRRLSCIIEKTELMELEEEIRDRFGSLPSETVNLLGLMSIRLLLKSFGITRLDVSDHSVTVTFTNNTSFDREKLAQLVNSQPNRFKFLSQDKLKIFADKISPLTKPLDAERLIESLIR